MISSSPSPPLIITNGYSSRSGIHDRSGVFHLDGIEWSGGNGDSDDDDSGYTNTHPRKKEKINKKVSGTNGLGPEASGTLFALVAPGLSST